MPGPPRGGPCPAAASGVVAGGGDRRPDVFAPPGEAVVGVLGAGPGPQGRRGDHSEGLREGGRNLDSRCTPARGVSPGAGPPASAGDPDFFESSARGGSPCLPSFIAIAT